MASEDIEDIEDEDEDEELEDDEDITLEEQQRRRKRPRGTSVSGWCLEPNSEGHKYCPINVGSYSCPCSCDDHGTLYGTPRPEKQRAFSLEKLED